MTALRHFRHRFAVLWLTCLVPVAGALADEPAKQLSNDDLRSMLENMGHRFTEHKYSSGNIYFEVKTNVEGTAYFVKVSGGGSEQIWLVADLITLKPTQRIPPEILEKMLEANSNATYVAYSLVPKSHELRIKGALVNEGLRPLVLREAIDEAAQVCANTTDLWWPDNWPKTLEKLAAQNAEKPAEEPAKESTEKADSESKSQPENPPKTASE